MLGALGIAMGIAGFAAAWFTADWPYWAIVAVSIVLGATGVGWNGVFLSEVARIAPGDQASRATGGALFITFFGVVTAPPIFGGIAALTGSFGHGFVVFAACALVSGTVVLRGRRAD